MSDKETQVCRCGYEKGNGHGQTCPLYEGKAFSPIEKPIEWETQLVNLGIEIRGDMTGNIEDVDYDKLKNFIRKEKFHSLSSLISEIEKMRKEIYEEDEEPEFEEYDGEAEENMENKGWNSALDSVIAKIKEKLDK